MYAEALKGHEMARVKGDTYAFIRDKSLVFEYVKNVCSSMRKDKATQYKREWETWKGIHRRQNNGQNPPLSLKIRKVHTDITVRQSWCHTPPPQHSGGTGSKSRHLKAAWAPQWDLSQKISAYQSSTGWGCCSVVEHMPDVHKFTSIMPHVLNKKFGSIQLQGV